MKNILVIYATAGIGHKKAAFAVKKALDEIAPKDISVSIIDSLDYSSAMLKFSYIKGYLVLVNKFPRLWGLMYYITDNRLMNLIVSRFVRLSNWLNCRGLAKYLVETQPDCIVSTHFLASEVAAHLKSRDKLKSRLFTVVTDFRLHSWWLAESTDTYIVSSEEAKSDLIRWGENQFKIKVLGIPIEPIFSRQLDKDGIVRDKGLKRGFLTILVIGGGFGVGPIEGIIRAIDGVGEAMQVVVVCGHNAALMKRLDELKERLKIDVKILGFIDNVHEYMEVADILISKSGGITVSESLAKRLPIIVMSPILGQETRNSDFLVSHNAACRIERLEDLKGVLEAMVKDPERIEKMKLSIDAIKKPEACYDIARLAVEACEKGAG